MPSTAKSASGASTIHHVNLQTIVGGGEIYTRAMTRALLDAGHEVVLYVHPENRFWDGLASDAVQLVPARDERELAARIPPARETFIVHTKISEELAKRIAERNRLLGFAHLPMHQRTPEWLGHCTLVATVSQYCIGLLRAAGVRPLYPEPMYGVADIARGDPDAPVMATSPYLWDRRKARDRLLGSLQPIFGLAKEAQYEKRPGLTLGIVSLIVPIKQFPLLFSHLAPVLARHADVNLEIFGAGGYAQVRDLKKELLPLKSKARLWGYQQNVAAVYRKIDYLLTGLPEKEALGLNVLEAQMCGTPVLAPKAPPFTETVLDGQTGHFYRDPRDDAGADFERLLQSIGQGAKLEPLKAAKHLETFAYPAFLARVQGLLSTLKA